MSNIASLSQPDGILGSCYEHPSTVPVKRRDYLSALSIQNIES